MPVVGKSFNFDTAAFTVGLEGPQGPPGPQGPVGPQGPAGPVSPNAVVEDDPGTQTIIGQLEIAAPEAWHILNSTEATGSAGIQFRRNAADRWNVQAVFPDETGGDAGSDFGIWGANDSGFYTRTAPDFSINRATGTTTLGGDLVISKLDPTLNFYAPTGATANLEVVINNVPYWSIESNSGSYSIWGTGGGAFRSVADLSVDSATGEVSVAFDPTTPLGVATKQYVDTAVAGVGSGNAVMKDDPAEQTMVGPLKIDSASSSYITLTSDFPGIELDGTLAAWPWLSFAADNHWWNVDVTADFTIKNSTDSGANYNDRFKIDSAGHITNGHASITSLWGVDAAFQLDWDASSKSSVALQSWGAGLTSDIYFVKSNGTTIGSHVAVTDNTPIGYIGFGGSDGTEFQECANIYGMVDGTVSAGSVPGRLLFSTAKAGDTYATEAMRLDSNGRITQGGFPAFEIDGSNVRQTIYMPTATYPYEYGLRLHGYENDNTAPSIIFSKTKGATPEAHAAVVSSAHLGLIDYYSSDGTGWVCPGSIILRAEGTISTGIIPARFEFYAANGAGTLASRMQISGTNGVTVAADPTLPLGVATKQYVDSVATGGGLPITGGTMTGNLTIDTPGAVSSLTLNKADGEYNLIYGNQGGLARWAIAVGDNGSETGSTVGSDFRIYRYTDAGGLLDTALRIVRADGAMVSTGDFWVARAEPTIHLNKNASGGSNAIFGRTTNVPRWVVELGGPDAESGGDAGSSFNIWRYSDAGAVLGGSPVMQVDRSNGNTVFSSNVLSNAGFSTNGYYRGTYFQDPTGLGAYFQLTSGGGATSLINRGGASATAFEIYGATAQTGNLQDWKDSQASNKPIATLGIDRSFRIYNTYTDASNWERAVFSWNEYPNTLKIATKRSGSGADRDITLSAAEDYVTLTLNSAAQTISAKSGGFQLLNRPGINDTTALSWENNISGSLAAIRLAGGSRELFQIGSTGTGNVSNVTVGPDALGAMAQAYIDLGIFDVTLRHPSGGSIHLGGPDAAAPTQQIISQQSVLAGTSNTAGVATLIEGSKGTGTGVGGSIIFRTAPAGTTGTAQNALSDRLQITQNSIILPASTRILDTVATLTDAATVALDAALGNTFKLLAAGNRTISAPTNKPAAGQSQKIVIMHEASGADRTLALTTGSAGSFRFGTDITALTATTSGLVDYIGCLYNAADDRWDVVSYSKGY